MAQAQPQAAAKTFRVGILALGTPRAAPAAQLFLQALRERGYVESQNTCRRWRVSSCSSRWT